MLIKKVRQGYISNIIVTNITEYVLKNAVQGVFNGKRKGIDISGENINNLRYAGDDTVLKADNAKIQKY